MLLSIYVDLAVTGRAKYFESGGGNGSEENNPEINTDFINHRDQWWYRYDAIPTANTWTFNVFDFVQENDYALVKLAGFVLAQGGLIERFNIDKYKLYNFLKDVEESYNPEVPYHNAKHATDILQAVYYSLNKMSSSGTALKDLLSAEETLSLVLAVIGHDIGHIGRTNHFLTLTKHEFAMIDPESPNEAMHFRLFREKLTKWDIFGHLPEDQSQKIMSNIEILILATNMDHHERILKQWRSNLANFTLSSPLCRMALMKYVLKFCDVSNPARGQPLYREWTLLLREEMYREGDHMEMLGMAVDGARDRNLPSTIAKIQCWFIENRVQRYLRSIKEVGISLDEPLHQLQVNLKKWRQKQVC